MKKKIKVFVPYGSVGYANWIPRGELVKTMEEADLVLLTGGEDCDPKLYGEREGSQTYFNPTREKIEVEAGRKAIKMGKPLWGTCKGLQMINILAGGTLIQHMSHPGGHDIMTSDGKKLHVNSLHHQAINPYNLPKENYEILSTSTYKSPVHLNGEDVDITKYVPEDIETAFFPKIKALGHQFHLEMMSKGGNEELFQWTEDLLKEKLGLDI